MPATATFVVHVGRDSMGTLVARPLIEQIVGKYGGTVRPGGAGSSQDPIVADFADKGAAQEAAKELWYHDSIESAYVHDTDNLATSTIREGVAAGKVDPVEAVMQGVSVSETIDAFIDAATAGRLTVEEDEAADADGDGEDGKVEESCLADPAELPKIKELAEELEEIVKNFCCLKTDTAAVFVQDAKAAADALRKIVSSYPQA